MCSTCTVDLFKYEHFFSNMTVNTGSLQRSCRVDLFKIVLLQHFSQMSYGYHAGCYNARDAYKRLTTNTHQKYRVHHSHLFGVGYTTDHHVLVAMFTRSTYNCRYIDLSWLTVMYLYLWHVLADIHQRKRSNNFFYFLLPALWTS